MKALLPVDITESQKGEFPNPTNQLWSFPSAADFTFFSGPAQSPSASSPCSLERCWLSAV